MKRSPLDAMVTCSTRLLVFSPRSIDLRWNGSLGAPASHDSEFVLTMQERLDYVPTETVGKGSMIFSICMKLTKRVFKLQHKFWVIDDKQAGAARARTLRRVSGCCSVNLITSRSRPLAGSVKKPTARPPRLSGLLVSSAGDSLWWASK